MMCRRNKKGCPSPALGPERAEKILQKGIKDK